MKKNRIFGLGILLINNPLQLTVLLYSLVLAVVVSLINYFYQLSLSGQFGILTRWKLYLLFPIGSLILFAAIVVFGLSLTNRIAGPIYRLRRHMESIIDGHPARDISFRENDFFVEVIAPYNKLLKLLKEDSIVVESSKKPQDS